tara:strand:- start:493 stop:603 length:111 start_codon:yes stop_codon:yes gene_type:complete
MDTEKLKDEQEQEQEQNPNPKVGGECPETDDEVNDA